LGTLMVKFMPQVNAAAVVQVIEKCGIPAQAAMVEQATASAASAAVAAASFAAAAAASAAASRDGDGTAAAAAAAGGGSAAAAASAGALVAWQLVRGLRVASLWRDALDADSRLLVPQVQFFENARQLMHLHDVALDLERGEHVLLVGNQGVGKNKIADYLLQLLRAPREYVQLHRDTTVDQLTVVPQIVAGKLHFLDSPLVRAAVLGRVAVVDEADKASTHVTILLKSLAEDRQLLLPDGRRLVPPEMAAAAAAAATAAAGGVGSSTSGQLIPVHPNFRMIVLANRPGYV
jgi:hypothetical protein